MAVVSALAVTVLVLAAGAAACDSDAAANGFVIFDDDVVKVEGVAEATIRLDIPDSYEQAGITYSAKLVDGEGSTMSEAVSPSTGSLTPSVPATLEVTAPEKAGKYRLIVTFTYSLDDGDDLKLVKEAVLKAVEPIALTVELTNTSDVDVLGLLLDFYVDGRKVNQDPVEAGRIAAGATASVTYDYATDTSGGAHTFKVMVSEDSLIEGNITGLGKEHTFYIGMDSHTWMNVLMAIILVVIVLVAVYVHRKPVKNYGKPRARR
jgi:hypothetical protein